ncbi:MAG: hypothetical protein ACU84H_16670 [Gammaproteobacteria bacterium]
MNTVPESEPPNEPKVSRQKQLGTLRILVGLFGAPAAWLLQLTISESVAAHACYPYRAPLPEPIWGQLLVFLDVIALACLLAALLSGLVAWNSWRQIARKPA